LEDKKSGLLEDAFDVFRGLLSPETWERAAEGYQQDPIRRPRQQDESFSAYLKRAHPEAQSMAEGFSGGVVRNVGMGIFGPQIAASSWREAVEALKSLQAATPGKGEIVGHLQHPKIGDIGAPWGGAGTGSSDGWGLAKLLEHHPEVVEDLPRIISGLEPVKSSPNRVRLESPTHEAAVRLTWDTQAKKWLLTAYEKQKNAPP